MLDGEVNGQQFSILSFFFKVSSSDSQPLSSRCYKTADTLIRRIGEQGELCLIFECARGVAVGNFLMISRIASRACDHTISVVFLVHCPAVRWSMQRFSRYWVKIFCRNLPCRGICGSLALSGFWYSRIAFTVESLLLRPDSQKFYFRLIEHAFRWINYTQFSSSNPSNTSRCRNAPQMKTTRWGYRQYKHNRSLLKCHPQNVGMFVQFLRPKDTFRNSYIPKGTVTAIFGMSSSATGIWW